MKNVIIIRYGELHLKGNNRGYFERRLIQNIKSSLKDITCTLKVDRGRYQVGDYAAHDENAIVERLSCVFGIHSISRGLVCATDIDTLVDACLVLYKGGSFKVETNRADKRYELSSYQVSATVGAKILEKLNNATVDLHNPSSIIYIDIRSVEYAFVYVGATVVQGGLPYGTGGKGLLMLSGGIDSPVAGYKIAKRGVEIVAVHFWSYPYTSEASKQKVEQLVKLLDKFCPNIKLYIVNTTKIQEAIKQHCDDEYLISILRRCMLRVSKGIAQKLNLNCIITGESLGQVASQTLDSINVSNNAIQDIPIFRPLIGMDKQEIIEIAQKINTYNTSTLPYEDCCTVFMPQKPVIRPTRQRAMYNESQIPDLEGMIQWAIEDALKIQNA